MRRSQKFSTHASFSSAKTIWGLAAIYMQEHTLMWYVLAEINKYGTFDGQH